MKNPFKNIFSKHKKMFHEVYPEILEYIINDDLIVNYHCGYKYKGVDVAKDCIIVQNSGVLETHSIKQCYNESLEYRRINMKLKDSYNQYLLDVQQAIKELQYHER